MKRLLVLLLQLLMLLVLLLLLRFFTEKVNNKFSVTLISFRTFITLSNNNNNIMMKTRYNVVLVNKYSSATVTDVTICSFVR
jgi:positive regulator of sigma E activity